MDLLGSGSVSEALPGTVYGQGEAAAGEGPWCPLSNQACPPNRQHRLQALGFSPASKYHFIGFCDICLVLNAEPCPKGRRLREEHRIEF